MIGAAFAAGLAAGLVLALIICLFGVAVAGVVAWRWARALERAGLDIHLNEPKVHELGQ